jgi:hypothetical protein
MLSAAAEAAAAAAAAASSCTATACLPPLIPSSVIADDEAQFAAYLAAAADAVRDSQQLARDVLEDVDSEFSSLEAVWKHFLDWRASYPKQYAALALMYQFRRF